MRSWLASILLLMVSAPLLAQTAAKPKTSTTTTTTTTTTTAAKPKAKKPATMAKKPATMPKKPMAKPTTATEIKTLRDAVSAQQQQIQMLRDELHAMHRANGQRYRYASGCDCNAGGRVQQPLDNARNAAVALRNAVAALPKRG